MLQYALRIGLRRHLCASTPFLRAMNTSTGPVTRVDAILSSGQEKLETRDDSDLRSSGENEAESLVERGIPFESSETPTPLRPPSKAETANAPRLKDINGGSSGDCSSQLRPRFPRNDSRKAILVSTSVDVNSLATHEMRASTREDEPEFIPDSELQGSLKVVMPIPFKRSQYSLPDPATPRELELRMHQILTFAPLPSLSRLLRYHDLFPSLHSAASYNLLIQLAIRHTSYSKAFQLLRRMEERGIKPNTYSKVLYIRALVRIGRWNHGWKIVRQQIQFGNDKSALPLLLELLGFHKPVEFRRDTKDTSKGPHNGDYDASIARKCQKTILSAIPNFLPPDSHPPIHFVLTVVRHLLRISRTRTARAVTMEWICHLPEKLSLPRKRHCLYLLHLHLAFSSKTTEAYFSNRQFVDLFLRRRPDLRPNSTTLFLLLRSLTRARGKVTRHAIGVLRAFRKKWGSNMIDRRVRRRVVHIALREGRLGVARRWMEAEDRASRPRKLMALQRAAVGEQAVKLPQKVRRMPFRKLMPGIDEENRKWRWLKRRFWRRKQSRLSRQIRPRMLSPQGEKNVVDRPNVGVEGRASS